LIGPDRLLAAVVKSNAYGHNLIDFSLEAESMDIDLLAVDSIIEGKTLREKGVKKPILVLGYTLKDDVEYAASNNISLTIADFPTLENLQNIKSGKNKIKIHLKIDTGMHRQGFFVSEIPEVIRTLKRLKDKIVTEGIYTHFASAKNPSFRAVTMGQIGDFKKATDVMEKEGFQNLTKHAAATSGTIIFPESHFDMVRVGIGVYGLWPSKETKAAFKNKLSLKPVLSWKTIISQVKELPEGSFVGYDMTERLDRPSRVAILPIGYWHGFPLSLSSIGEVIIRGEKAKVLGRVCMDMTLVDITDIKDVKIGDEVTLIGKEGEEEIAADDLSFLAGTSTYEIITCLNPRIKRVFT